MCGCGGSPSNGRKFISGHNLRLVVKTDEHRRRIGEGQRRAWATTRERKPVGSTYRNAYGYLVEKVEPGAAPWRLQHVLVVERRIGRRLRPEEVVHHINGVRDDNRDENLFLCANRSEHNEIERSLAALVRELMEQGLVRFNPEAKRYEPTEALLR